MNLLLLLLLGSVGQSPWSPGPAVSQWQSSSQWDLSAADVKPPIIIQKGRHVRTLPADATKAQIDRAKIAVFFLDKLDRDREVRPRPVPFSKSSGQRQTAQRDRLGVDDARSGIRFHAGHSCPACGASQFIISGSGPKAGTHTHSCPRCGTTWFH